MHVAIAMPASQGELVRCCMLVESVAGMQRFNRKEAMSENIRKRPRERHRVGRCVEAILKKQTLKYFHKVEDR